MVMSLFTACGSSDEETTTKATTKATNTTTTAPAGDDTTAGSVGEGQTPFEEGTTTVKPITDTAEDITKDPIFFEDFNDDDVAVDAVLRPGDNDNGGNAGALPTADEAAAQGKELILVTNDTDADATVPDGTQALFLDGSYGAIASYDFSALSQYTVSFWINPARYSQYGTMLTLGQDLLASNNECSWINVTKIKDWLSFDMAPVIWSRSMKASYEVKPEGAGDNVWPWYCEAYFGGYEGNEMTKKEWHHVVIVVDDTIDFMDPVTGEMVPGTVKSITYVDGQLFGVGAVAKYCMDENSQIFIGINCWDTMQKGYYDNIAVYDYCLTAGQVYGLYKAQGGTK